MTAQLAHGTNPPQSHKERFIRLVRRAPSLFLGTPFPSTDHFSGTTMPGHTSVALEGYAKLWE